MARRPHVVSIRLTDHELACIDQARLNGERRSETVRRLTTTAAVPPGVHSPYLAALPRTVGAPSTVTLTMRTPHLCTYTAA